MNTGENVTFSGCFRPYMTLITAQDQSIMAHGIVRQDTFPTFPHICEHSISCVHCVRVLYHTQTPLAICFVICPKLKDFWAEILNTLSEVCEARVPPNPKTAIFGIPPRIYNFQPTKQHLWPSPHSWHGGVFCSHGEEKKKKNSPPSHKQWVKDTLTHLEVEQLR